MKIGIIDLCKQIEDPRMNRKKVHKMETIIYISIAAVICGAQSWNEIEEFGNAKIAFFKSRIPGLEFIPSHDTFNRFFSIIKPEYFELIFRNWVKQVCQEVKGVVAIFREDYSKKVKNAARNFSVATKMALTILKNEKTTKGSMNLKRLKAGWDEKYLSQLLQENNF